MPAIPINDSPSASTLPIRKHKFSTPLLRLQLNDLSHEGSSIFLSTVHGNEDLEGQVQNVLNLLYTPSCKRPGTRSVTFVIRDMGGVAYTTGKDIDQDHKEIHISLEYIKAQGDKSLADQRHELLGVLCHELVHCFQWNAEGSCPGGLIEGVADWVRLNAGLAAKHWKREADGEWDGGYQHTGFFLQYLEDRFGQGTVRHINSCLRKGQYDEEKLWKECCDGNTVHELWKAYQKHVKKNTDSEDDIPLASESKPGMGSLEQIQQPAIDLSGD